jgi:integrase
LDPYWTLEEQAMARKVRDSNLESRSGRARLKTAHKPYYRLIEPGLHLGYRKNASGPGAWIVRRYTGNGNYTAENLRTADGTLIVADDFSEADGHVILTFAQAQERAKAHRPVDRQSKGPYTVANALEDYLEFLEDDGRSRHLIQDVRSRAAIHILPALGPMKVAALTTKRLRRWHSGVAKSAPRLRAGNGKPAQYRAVVDGDETKRRRRSSANRTWTVLRAALNHAFHDGNVASDIPWRKVKPFRNVDAARVRYLTVAESRRLINAADPEFRPLVQAALVSGCRYGELIRLRVHDFNADSGTVAIQQSKSGKSRNVVLTDEGVALFTQLTVGRKGNERLLRRIDGQSWKASHQIRRMAEACRRGKIEPAVNFHGLRHSYASLTVMNGTPLLVVAQNLGHADTRMCERFYGHLAQSFVADAIRAGAPRFGLATANKVRAL